MSVGWRGEKGCRQKKEEVKRGGRARGEESEEGGGSRGESGWDFVVCVKFFFCFPIFF